MNVYRATLLWTPPSVDFEEIEEEIRVDGNDVGTVRQGLKQLIKKIEDRSGWSCDLKIRPCLRVVGPKEPEDGT